MFLFLPASFEGSGGVHTGASGGANTGARMRLLIGFSFFRKMWFDFPPFFLTENLFEGLPYRSMETLPPLKKL